MSVHQWKVIETLENRNEIHPTYPLLPGDLIVRDGETWMKVCPGLAVGGFALSDEDVSQLEPADDVRWVIE